MKSLATLLCFFSLIGSAYSFGGFLNQLGEDLGINIQIGMNANQKINQVNNDFAQFMGEGDAAIPLALIDQAECLMFIPNIIKAGIGVGGQTGVGIGTCRTESGHWTSPLFYRISAASFGLNLGAQRMDLVLVFTDRRTGLATLTQENVSLGLDSTITLGPIGREAQVSINFNDEGIGPVYAYAKSEGLMLDLISVRGSTVTPAKNLNRQAYGFEFASNAFTGMFRNTPQGLLDFINDFLY